MNCQDSLLFEDARLSTPTRLVSRVDRPRTAGKFLFSGEEKLWDRGVSYRKFPADAQGREHHRQEVVNRDFSLMADNGINAIRTYTVPPKGFLDTALRYGRRV